MAAVSQTEDPHLDIEDTHMLVYAALNKTIEAGVGGASVKHTRTWTSNVVLGALCPRALLASTPDVSWK